MPPGYLPTGPVTRRRLRTISVATVVLAAAMMTVATGAAPQGSAAPLAKRVVSARTTAAFAMPVPGFATVQSVTLSAGAWTVIAKAAAINSSSSDIVRCQLYDATNAVALDAASYEVGHLRSNGGPITNLATLEVPAGRTVKVDQQCGHDIDNGDSAYLDPDASLVAFEAIGGQSTAQTLTRTTGSTSLTTSPTTVLSLTLPAGNYAVGFKMTAVTFSNEALVTCSLESSQGYAGGAAVLVGTPAAAATDAFFTYVAGIRRVYLQCSLTTGTPGAYLDPGTVLWARQANAVTAVVNGCGAGLINGTTDLVTMVRPGQGCSISGETALSKASVVKGTWVAVGGESVIYNINTSADFARCELLSGTGHLDGTAVWEAPSAQVGVTVLGSVTLAATSTFTERCTRDVSGAQSGTSDGSLVLIRP